MKLFFSFKKNKFTPPPPPPPKDLKIPGPMASFKNALACLLFWLFLIFQAAHSPLLSADPSQTKAVHLKNKLAEDNKALKSSAKKKSRFNKILRAKLCDQRKLLKNQTLTKQNINSLHSKLKTQNLTSKTLNPFASHLKTEPDQKSKELGFYKARLSLIVAQALFPSAYASGYTQTCASQGGTCKTNEDCEHNDTKECCHIGKKWFGDKCLPDNQQSQCEYHNNGHSTEKQWFPDIDSDDKCCYPDWVQTQEMGGIAKFTACCRPGTKISGKTCIEPQKADCRNQHRAWNSTGNKGEGECCEKNHVVKNNRCEKCPKNFKVAFNGGYEGECYCTGRSGGVREIEWNGQKICCGIAQWVERGECVDQCAYGSENNTSSICEECAEGRQSDSSGNCCAENQKLRNGECVNDCNQDTDFLLSKNWTNNNGVCECDTSKYSQFRNNCANLKNYCEIILNGVCKPPDNDCNVVDSDTHDPDLCCQPKSKKEWKANGQCEDRDNLNGADPACNGTCKNGNTTCNENNCCPTGSYWLGKGENKTCCKIGLFLSNASCVEICPKNQVVGADDNNFICVNKNQVEDKTEQAQCENTEGKKWFSTGDGLCCKEGQIPNDNATGCQTANNCPDWKKHEAFRPNGQVSASFCDTYASDKRACKRALQKMKRLANKIARAQKNLEKKEDERWEERYGEGSDEEKTESGGLCFDCLKRALEASRPSAGQQIGNALSILAGAGISAVGYNMGRRAQYDANMQRIDRGGYAARNDLYSFAGARAGFPFVHRGIYGMTRVGDPAGGWSCSPSVNSYSY